MFIHSLHTATLTTLCAAVGRKLLHVYRVCCLRERETKPQPNDMLKIGYCLFVLSFNIYSGHFLCYSMLSAYAGE